MRSNSLPSERSDTAADVDEDTHSLPTFLTSVRTHWRHILWFCIWFGGCYVAFTFDVSALQLYIILTIFYLILTNLGERRTGPSAYSVFNRNCEPIMGQLSAQQFDNEVRRRAVDFHATQPHRRVIHASGSTPDAHDELLQSLRSQIQADYRASRRRSAFATSSSRPRRQ